MIEKNLATAIGRELHRNIKDVRSIFIAGSQLVVTLRKIAQNTLFAHETCRWL